MTIDQIIANIKVQMQPIMAKWKAWQLDNLAKYRAILESDEYKALPSCAWTRKSWLANKGYDSKFMMQNKNNGSVWWDEYLDKQIDNKLLKIDFAVHKKVGTFEAVEIKQILAYASSKDGFVEGMWKLTNAEGKSKTLRVETIYAGGYNIQCFHVRTLYKFK